MVAGRPLAAQGGAAAPLELQYRVSLPRPATHLVEVEITAGKVVERTLDFVMPAWSPGRYAIYDFAKNVQEFEARDAQDHALPWTKLDKETWRVEVGARPGATGAVRVRYRVYGNDLSGTFSQIDNTHANLNGASVFMYVAGHQREPLSLSVELPAGANPPWKIVSGHSLSTDQRSFHVPSYDLLIDTPLEISAECALDQFQENGRTIRVAVHTYAEGDDNRSKLIEGLRKIVRSELAMMPPDFEHYTFIFHFDPSLPLGDGMEHFNSTQVVVRGSLKEGGVDEAIETAAHELFHLWNVKRLRPFGLGPFDYTHENYTRSLWFAEGVTSYYSFLHLLRSGMWTRQQFLNRLAQEIRQLESEPGRELMSAESSSFHAWFYDRSPQMQETNFANTTISYYNKGALLGMLLDLEIRSRTNGQKSLDDVLVALYRRFYETPAPSSSGAGARSNDYAPGQGYGGNDIQEAVKAVAGSDFKTFFDRYVRGTEPLPYAQALAQAGLELRMAVAPDAVPGLGALTQREERGVRIVAVRPGRAADRGRLSRGDMLTEVDGLSLITDDLKDRLKIYPPGASVPFTVERHGKQDLIFVILDPPEATQYSIEPLPGASVEQVGIRDGWLGSERRGDRAAPAQRSPPDDAP